MSSINLLDQRSRVSIIDFPPELLLMIFKNVHDEVAMHRELGRSYWPKWKKRDLWSHSPTFPYTFASVSKVWNEVTAMEPTFWTNIVIFVDSDEFSLASISSHLTYSCQLPIDVRVVKKAPDLLPASEAHENRRLQAIADIIRPHTYRCLSLHYKVTYTSSLPRISTYLQDTFPLLDDLRLEASNSSETIETPAAVAWDIQCPSLICLALDGVNFIDVFINAPHLLDQVQRKLELLSKIGVSHLRQSPNHVANRLSLGDVWPLISQADTLHLEDLDLDCDTHATYEDVSYDRSALTLVDLNTSITSTILSCYDSIHSIKIARCSLDDLRRIPFAGCLSLVEIDDVESLSRLLPRWNGCHLHVHNCLAFSDALLMAIEGGYLISHLITLSIENCFNFSPAVLCHAMKNFVGPRKFLLKGQNVPAMMDRDKEWFSVKGIILSWNE